MSMSRGIRHVPAIDGLRAVAVIAVILYHLDFSWIPGGFLGVDLFFVISGYVITRLLLDSIQRECFSLPDETQFISGHGPMSTIGYEKQYNPFVASKAG